VHHYLLTYLHSNQLEKTLYIYINKDGNPSTKSTRHVEANVNTQKENQNNQNSSNEVEDLMLKGHPLPKIT
jgi:hypothetical protein